MSPPVLLRMPDGRLGCQVGETAVAVEIVRCFPWMAPDRFLSLRNAEGGELAFLQSPADLEAASRALLEQELEESGRTFVIESVTDLRKELELRCWEVNTRQGPRSFQTELDEWPRELPAGGLLIEDLFGDLYVIPDPGKLDPVSRRFVWPLMG